MRKRLAIITAAVIAASLASARTVTVDSLNGTSATVTVGPGEYTEGLKFYYGVDDGGDDASAWDNATTNLAEVTAAGGTFTVTLPIDPSKDAPCSRFALTDPYIHNVSYIAGDGQTWFDTGIVNTSRDTVVMEYTVVGVDADYNLIYGYRDSAFSRNISLMESRGTGAPIADFTTSSMTSGTVPGRIDFPRRDDNLYYQYIGLPIRNTVTLSAAKRVVVSDGSVSSQADTNTEASVSEAFECSGPARLFSVGGNVPGNGGPIVSEIHFHECKVFRDDELICDFIPVRATVNGRMLPAIYDQKRHVFAACSTNNPALLGYGATSRVVINSMSECMHSSSYVDLVATPAARGISLTADNSTAKDAVIYMTCNASDATADLGNWATVVKVADLAAGETLSTTIPYPEGWGDTVNAVRFAAYDVGPYYLQSSGTQYIDTCWTNGSNHVVEMVFQPLNQFSDNAQAFYGCRNGPADKNIVMFVDKIGFSLDFNNSAYNTYRLSNVTRKSDYRYRMLDSAAKRVAEWSQDGVVKGAATNATACADNFTCAGSAYLFAANDMSGGSPAILWSGNGLLPIRLYSLKVWTTDGTLVSEILPVKVGGVAKAYDTVRDRYFENAGSGDFTLGTVAATILSRTAAILSSDWPKVVGTIISIR